VFFLFLYVLRVSTVEDRHNPEPGRAGERFGRRGTREVSEGLKLSLRPKQPFRLKGFRSRV